MDGLKFLSYSFFFFQLTQQIFFFFPLKLVADAAHAEIINCHLEQQADWDNAGPIHAHTPPRQGAAGWAVLWAVTVP